MKKKSNTWIAAGLLTIVAAITTVYCLLEYRGSVLAVGISSLFLLGSAFWLFLSIARLQKQTPTVSIGEEQRERMDYEGMKLQGEELIRLANTLGKGAYVYNKRSSEHLEELLNQVMQNQQANEALIQALMQSQTKAAKFQVKYGRDDTEKVVAALTANFTQINHNLEKCIESIANQATDSNPVSHSNIVASLSDLSRELAHINNSIQALQIQLTTSVQQPVMYAPIQPQPIEEPAAMMDAIPAEEPVAMMDAIPAEEPVAMMDTFTTDDSLTMTESTPAEEPVITMEETAATEETPDVSTVASGDSNKQLSADEIAALFAALG